MSQQRESTLTLYHGTSTLFLPGIREHGLGGHNVLGPWGFYDLIRELAPLCEGKCEDIDNYIFDKIVKQQAGHSNFQHGQTYLSPSRLTAARYAASNIYGSELVSEALTRVNILFGHDCGIEELLSRYPKIEEIRGGNHRPILISVRDAERFEFLTEHGSDATRRMEAVLNTLDQTPEKMELLHQQDNFRLKSLVPYDELHLESIIVTGSMCGMPIFEITQFSE